jgi:hypothetical protein
VAQREVEAHRVAGIDVPERFGDGRGHVPARCPVTRQAEALADADDVYIEGDHEARG